MSRPDLLIIVRAGRQSIHRSYASSCSRLADILVSTYDGSDWRGPEARFVHAAPGGKFQGLAALFAENPDLINAYRHFWLFEDDLYLPYASLEAILPYLSRGDVALASPSLSPQSHFSWAMCMQNENLLLRGTDFVEIMAPIMSRAFLAACLPHFDANFSGYGHEWLWRKLLREQNRFALIFDAAPIVHTRPHGRGSIAANAPDGAAGLAGELRSFLDRFGFDVNDRFRNLFGIARAQPGRLLFGQDLVNAMLPGYGSLFAFDYARAVFCIEALLKANRPEMTSGDAGGLVGFQALQAAASRAASGA